MARVRQALAVVLVLAFFITAAVLIHHESVETTEIPEISEVDEWLADLEDFLDLENQSYNFELSELYSGWE